MLVASAAETLASCETPPLHFHQGFSSELRVERKEGKTMDTESSSFGSEGQSLREAAGFPRSLASVLETDFALTLKF